MTFIVFMLALYGGIALVFVTAGIRHWVWRPIIGKFRRKRPENQYPTITSTSREESLS